MARTPGAKNKIPQAAKENIHSVFVRLGGTAAMAKWAKENLTEFYKIYARLIPIEHTGEVTNYVLRAPDPIKTAEEWEQRYIHHHH